MNSRERANYIDNMPYEMFKELLTTSNRVNTSYDRASKILECSSVEKIADTRGNARETLNTDMLIGCVRARETQLTAKMVSLGIVFANPVSNPDYFNELCEVFSTDSKNGEKLVNYAEIAKAYNTTVDNVKSNILFGEVVKKLAQKSNKKVR